MSLPPANLARALTRGFLLLFAAELVSAGLGCGTETFDLLHDQGSHGGLGGTGGLLGIGGTRSPGAGGGGTSSGGTGAGGESSGGRNSGGFGGFGHGGSLVHPSGGMGNFGTGFGGVPDGGCLPGESCVDGGARCPPDATFCRQCETDNDCTPDARFCDQIDGRCVECFPGKLDCKDGETCDPTLLRCAKICASSADCTRYCSRSHICVECQQNADCRGEPGQEKYSCLYGFCVECENDSDCPDPTREVCQALKCVLRQ